MKPYPLPLLAAALPLVLASALPAQTALTVYNQDFAVVREMVPLDLKKGVNELAFDHATLRVEPDSVVLRDPSGKVALQILEQSYRSETASEGLLLSLFEGQEIEFRTENSDNGEERIVRGKIIRSGYLPGEPGYGGRYLSKSGNGPIIEVDGKMRFTLPGEPIFPSLGDDSILRPRLSWKLTSDRAASFNAELGYITGGLSWSAAYNLVSPEKGDTLDVVGWVTINNRSGKTFSEAKVKLMAGNVSKLAPGNPTALHEFASMDPFSAPAPAPVVTQKAFDDFHLYSLAHPVTLRNREVKQVEFLRATNVKAATLYIYNGADMGRDYSGRSLEDIRNDRDYGIKSNPKVWVYREFKNTKENGLGLPLPKGRTRFYRQDDADNAIEFTGENTIDHTAENETVRIYTGDAFDIVGERKRTDYKLNDRNDELEEAFEIKIRNRKKETVEVRVVERMYRWFNWTMIENSDPYVKNDDRNIEIRVTLAPDEEKIVTYRVRYDWK